jgi:hypothetical protein
VIRNLLFTLLGLAAVLATGCAAVGNLLANTGRFAMAGAAGLLVLLAGLPVFLTATVAGFIGAIAFVITGPILTPGTRAVKAPTPVTSALTGAFWIAVVAGLVLLAVYERRRLVSVAKRVTKIVKRGAPGGPAARDK